jgi:hypothetical protein
MFPTSHLYDALSQFLRQREMQWRDVRHRQTLCWMISGMIQSQNVHLNGFGVYVKSRAQVAQSHQRRFRRWLSNRRIDVMSAHHALLKQALSTWQHKRLYLSLDTTMVWNCFCIVWVGVVYRGRTIPVAWRVVPQSSSTVRLWTIQRVLRQAARLIPDGIVVVLLADRGFADGKLMKYLRENLAWHFRMRIKRSFQFEHQGQCARYHRCDCNRDKLTSLGRCLSVKPSPTQMCILRSLMTSQVTKLGSLSVTNRPILDDSDRFLSSFGDPGSTTS